MNDSSYLRALFKSHRKLLRERVAQCIQHAWCTLTHPSSDHQPRPLLCPGSPPKGTSGELLTPLDNRHRRLSHHSNIDHFLTSLSGLSNYPHVHLPGHCRYSVAYYHNGNKTYNYPFRPRYSVPLALSLAPSPKGVVGVSYRPQSNFFFFHIKYF